MAHKLKKYTTYYWGFREITPTEFDSLSKEERVYVVTWDPAENEGIKSPFETFIARGAGEPSEPDEPNKNNLG